MDDKNADNDFPIHDLLRQRYSPRAYARGSVSLDQLASLFEAARWAPSCFNEQPWRFLVARRQDEDAFQTMLGCLMDGNQVWAKDAAVLMITVARTRFTHNEKPNRHGYHDVGLAMSMLTVQAMSMGLYVHQMGGFYLDETRTRYAIPEGYDPVAAVAIGHLGELDDLPEELRERERQPRTRRPLSEQVFSGSFGSPMDLQG